MTKRNNNANAATSDTNNSKATSTTGTPTSKHSKPKSTTTKTQSSIMMAFSPQGKKRSAPPKVDSSVRRSSTGHHKPTEEKGSNPTKKQDISSTPPGMKATHVAKDDNQHESPSPWKVDMAVVQANDIALDTKAFPTLVSPPRKETMDDTSITSSTESPKARLLKAALGKVQTRSKNPKKGNKSEEPEKEQQQELNKKEKAAEKRREKNKRKKASKKKRADEAKKAAAAAAEALKVEDTGDEGQEVFDSKDHDMEENQEDFSHSSLLTWDSQNSECPSFSQFSSFSIINCQKAFYKLKDYKRLAREILKHEKNQEAQQKIYEINMPIEDEDDHWSLLSWESDKSKLPDFEADETMDREQILQATKECYKLKDIKRKARTAMAMKKLKNKKKENEKKYDEKKKAKDALKGMGNYGHDYDAAFDSDKDDTEEQPPVISQNHPSSSQSLSSSRTEDHSQTSSIQTTQHPSTPPQEIRVSPTNTSPRKPSPTPSMIQKSPEQPPSTPPPEIRVSPIHNSPRKPSPTPSMIHNPTTSSNSPTPTTTTNQQLSPVAPTDTTMMNNRGNNTQEDSSAIPVATQRVASRVVGMDIEKQETQQEAWTRIEKKRRQLRQTQLKPMNCTRYSMKIMCDRLPFNEVNEATCENLYNMFSNIKEACNFEKQGDYLHIIPWMEADSRTLPIKNLSLIKGLNKTMRSKYFYGCYPKSRGGPEYCKVNIHHSNTREELKSAFQDALQDTGNAMWELTVQVDNITSCGWLLFSLPQMDRTFLAKAISAICGNIDLGLRWKAISMGNRRLQNPPKALHIECSKTDYPMLARRLSQKLGARTNPRNPGGTRIRWFPEFTELTNDASVSDYEKMANRQGQMEEATKEVIVEGKITDIDTKITGIDGEPTLRFLISRLKEKSGKYPLIHEVHVNWKDSDRIHFYVAKAFVAEAKVKMENLLTIFRTIYNNSVEQVFTTSAIWDAEEQQYDPLTDQVTSIFDQGIDSEIGDCEFVFDNLSTLEVASDDELDDNDDNAPISRKENLFSDDQSVVTRNLDGTLRRPSNIQAKNSHLTLEEREERLKQAEAALKIKERQFSDAAALEANQKLKSKGAGDNTIANLETRYRDDKLHTQFKSNSKGGVGFKK